MKNNSSEYISKLMDLSLTTPIMACIRPKLRVVFQHTTKCRNDFLPCYFFVSFFVFYRPRVSFHCTPPKLRLSIRLTSFERLCFFCFVLINLARSKILYRSIAIYVRLHVCHLFRTMATFGLVGSVHLLKCSFTLIVHVFSFARLLPSIRNKWVRKIVGVVVENKLNTKLNLVVLIHTEQDSRAT
jgi:hypothetical protein